MAHITGACRCGDVRYETSADPVFTGICHCKSCQRSTGSAFNTVIAVPAPSLTVHGTLKQFDSVGDSGQATHRGFCPECGTSVTMTADTMPGVVMLTAGTLDDTSWVQPGMQIYCDEAQSWVSLAGEMQRFGGMPMPG